MSKKQTFIWEHDKLYNSFPLYFKKLFNERVQKLSIDTGFTCPNRDGKKSFGGCTYCNNITFKPNYCENEKSISQQIEEGIVFFSKKYKTQKYLAYFQSFTNTYAPIEILKQKYEEALSHPSIIGLVIGTRPDCIDDEILNYLANLAKKNFIAIEFGVESTKNKTLDLINRCHSFEDTKNAIIKTVNKNIHVGVHLIIGLPKENEDDILNHAKELSKLPIKTLKLHQLQIIKGTKIANQFKERPEDFLFFTADDYINLIVKFLEILNPNIVVERFVSQAPQNLLISPKWGLKNFEIIAKLEKKLLSLKTFQGKKYFFK